MSRRILAVLKQEVFHTLRSLEVMIDLPFFSITGALLFGFVSLYIAGTNELIAMQLLLGLILWEIIRVTQYSMSVGVLWNIWSRNLSNMFISPLTTSEYLIAQMLSGIIKSVLIFLTLSLIMIFFFNFNIFEIGVLALVLIFVNLTLFSFAVGISLVGLIFRFGTKIQSLAWGIIFLLQPIMATFFPVDVLPNPLKAVAFTLPPTYMFEIARAQLKDLGINWQYALISFALNVFYLIFSIWFFQKMFNKSKENGQFARNEG